MRFVSAQDYSLFLHINNELVNNIVDVEIVIYKINVLETKKNIYGESTRKTWYDGIQIPCMLDISANNIVKDGQPLNVMQELTFSVLAEECKTRNVFLEIGDVVEFDHSFFEVDQINSVQYIAGQPIYNHSFTCHAHLTRDISTQLVSPIV